MNYKQEAIAKLAQQIKLEGFRVFIAKSGTYGIFCNREGTRVTSFQCDLSGISYFGNYVTDQPRRTGTGWKARQGAFADINAEYPPPWATNDAKWSFKTLEQMQKDYAASSCYVEL